MACDAATYTEERQCLRVQALYEHHIKFDKAYLPDSD